MQDTIKVIAWFSLFVGLGFLSTLALAWGKEVNNVWFLAGTIIMSVWFWAFFKTALNDD